MGQSNYNKTAVKAKEYGADNKSKLTGGYLAVCVVFIAAVVLFLLFSILVAANAIDCTGGQAPQGNTVTSQSDIPLYDVNGKPYYFSADGQFYFNDENGNRVDCQIDPETQTPYYIDADGNRVDIDFGTSASPSDAQASSSDVQTAPSDQANE